MPTSKRAASPGPVPERSTRQQPRPQLQIRRVTVGVVIVGRDVPGAGPPVTSTVVDELHREVFPREPRLLGPATVVTSGGERVSWHLTTGRTVTGAMQAHRTDLPFDYQALVVGYDVEDELSIDETIELMAQLSRTPERVVPYGSARDEPPSPPAPGTRSDWMSAWIKPPCFVMPVLYVAQFEPWLETAAELWATHAADVNALVNLWVGQADLVREEVIEDLRKHDVHPFNYGVTFFSPVCTVELHPRSTVEIARREGLTLEQHHYREWVFLTAMLTIIGFQRRALEDDASRLNDIASSSQGLSTWNLPGTLRRLRRLSTSRADILRRLALYHNVWLTRREYMDRILVSGRDNYGVSRLYAQVQESLAQLGDDLSGLFSASVSTVALVVSVVALLLSLCQLLLG